MHSPNRRELLKTTGVGAGVALGMGGASAQSTDSQTVQTAQSREAEKVFTATADSGFIVVNGDSASDGPIQFGSNSVDGDVSIEGVVYSDDTWESTRVNFPKLQPEDVLDDDDIPVVSPEDLDGDIDIQVDPITGTYNIDKEIVTGDFALTIDVDLSAAGIVSFDVEVSADAVLTTEQSGDMNGDVQGGLGDGTATVTLVNNEFDLPASGNDTIDNQLGLPSPSGRNYLEIALNLEITDVADQPDQPQPLTSFSATGTDGFISLGTSDPQTKRVNFGTANNREYTLNGQIYSDGTWESTSVDIPSVGLDKLIKNQASFSVLGFEIQVANVNTTINVEPISGKYKPQQGLVTGNLDVTIDVKVDLVEVFGITAGSLKFKVDPDTAPLTTKTSNGANTDPGMEGSASGLASGSPQVSLVSQEYNVDGVSGSDTSIAGIDVTGTINNVLNLPALAGSNWVRLDLDMSLDNPGALDGEIVFDPIVDPDPPQDLNGDELFEDVLGSGTLNEFDAPALFGNLDTDAVQSQSSIFTFAGGLDRTQVAAVDAQALHNAYLEITRDNNKDIDDFPKPPDVIVPGGEVDLEFQPQKSQVAEGETVPVDLVVKGADQGIEVFDMSVSLSDDTVASITSFEHGNDVEEEDSSIINEGGALDLRGITLDNPFQSSQELTLATFEVAAEEPGAATTLEFDVGSFPRGLFGDGTSQYQVASSPPETITIDFAAEIGIGPQKSRGGDKIEVTIPSPGNRGAYVGIWRTDGDGTPTQLLGTSEMGSIDPGSNLMVSLDEKITGEETVIAAVHPADGSAPDTTQILASQNATVELAPPKLSPGLPGPPKDLDGDGKYEAVRGNDEVNILDVQTLFNNLDNQTMQQEYAEFFKFQDGGSSEVTILDVQALFNKINN